MPFCENREEEDGEMIEDLKSCTMTTVVITIVISNLSDSLNPK